MNLQLGLESANAMQSAFRVRPEIVDEREMRSSPGVYSWCTPPMDGFSLPETDDLVVALHLGGSRKVRAVTDAGLSRSVSMPGLVTVLPPGRSASFQTAGSISLVTLHVPRSVFARQDGSASIERLVRSAPAHFAFRDAYACASMEALLRVARRGTAPSPDYVAKLTDALICHLASLGEDVAIDRSAGTLGQVTLDSLLATIDARLSDKLGVDQLAQQAGLSRAAFNRAFRQSTGLSFHQYLNRRRIGRARQMLRQTSFDLAYIAQELGFSNQSHFAAAFKALQHCTPRQFRNGIDG